ncbi:alpha/beta fold hydrolase [Streptomyces sp. NPDC006285]|uniref:alpha/beta fold hydrolase n=1 Tax=Streptomyces sp. NPDC006285 TaxID=3364742 RepID=UPI0036C9F9E1
MPIVSLKGMDFFYEQSGAGPELLFLNGSGATLVDAAPLLSVLAEDFEVAAFDQRGVGRTSMPAGPYTMAELAADALALATHLGWDRFRVLGVSFGGMVAQELAVTVPERIERLALLCTSSGGAGGSSYPLHALTQRGEEQRQPLPGRLFGAPGGENGGDADRLLGRVLSGRLAAQEPGAALQLRARAEHDVFDRLPRITCPTFVASGTHDMIAPPRRGSAIADHVPQSVFRVFTGGHLFFAEDPEAIPAVTQFLSGG